MTTDMLPSVASLVIQFFHGAARSVACCWPQCSYHDFARSSLGADPFKIRFGGHACKETSYIKSRGSLAVVIAAPISKRTNLSPFTKGCRDEGRKSMRLANFLKTCGLAARQSARRRLHNR